MGEFIFAVAALLGLVVPIAALIVAISAWRRQREIERRLRAIEGRLAVIDLQSTRAEKVEGVALDSPVGQAIAAAGVAAPPAPLAPVAITSDDRPPRAASGDVTTDVSEEFALAELAEAEAQARAAASAEAAAESVAAKEAAAPTDADASRERAPLVEAARAESSGTSAIDTAPEPAVVSVSRAAPPAEAAPLGAGVTSPQRLEATRHDDELAPIAVALPGQDSAAPRPVESPSRAQQGAAAAPRINAPIAPGPAASSLEERLGVTWLTRAGAAAFLLGALFFFKYAVENNWVGPWGREAIGVAVGVGLLAAGEAIRRTARAGFVQALTGIGLAVLFVTVWASVYFFELVPRPVAFVASLVLALLGAALSLRHKGQAILVLALVAAFLNPVLLSTGEDRPVELFAYLFLVTTVADVVAVRLRFSVVPYLAMLGVTGLFIGWYVEHGEAHDRALPLAVLALFGAAWCVSACVSGLREESDKTAAAAKAGAGLFFVSIGLSVALGREPEALAFASFFVAGAATATGFVLARPALFFAPLVASSTGLAIVLIGAAFSSRPVSEDSVVFAIVGAAFAYAAGPLDLRLAGPITKWRGVAATLPLLGASLFASAVYHGASGRALGSVLAAIVLAIAWFSRRARSPALVASSAGLLGLCVAVSAAVTTTGVDVLASTLEGAAAWALATAAAAAAFAPDPEQDADGWGACALGAIASLGFASAALAATSHLEEGHEWVMDLLDDKRLRAVLVAGAGILDVALGGFVALRGRKAAPVTASSASEAPMAARGAAPLFGLALALFAAAAAFAFGGATATALWAMMAAVAAAVAGRANDKTWLGTAWLLLLATLGRALFVDVLGMQDQLSAFMETRGQHGVLVPPPFLNERAIALFATALGLLVAARATWKISPITAARVAAVLGYGLLVVMVSTEAHTLARSLPTPPRVPASDAEWSAFLNRLEAADAATEGARAMVGTLVIAVGAAVLLAAGFLARSRFHRYLGLAGFLLASLKLGLWDVWHVERVYQVVLLTGVGALLVAGGFLYARFGKRLVALLQATEGSVAPSGAKAGSAQPAPGSE